MSRCDLIKMYCDVINIEQLPTSSTPSHIRAIFLSRIVLNLISIYFIVSYCTFEKIYYGCEKPCNSPQI